MRRFTMLTVPPFATMPAFAGHGEPGLRGDLWMSEGRPRGRGRGRRGHHGPPFGPWSGRGARARRGDVRLAVLTLLAEEPMHGYQVIQELEARSGGAWRPSPGSVYPTLQLLEDEGLVVAHEVEGKRVFSLTDAGRAALAEVGEEAPPWEALAREEGSGAAELRDAAFQLGAAVMQVARTGSAAQAAATLEILREARRKVYGLLAEGE